MPSRSWATSEARAGEDSGTASTFAPCCRVDGVIACSYHPRSCETDAYTSSATPACWRALNIGSGLLLAACVRSWIPFETPTASTWLPSAASGSVIEASQLATEQEPQLIASEFRFDPIIAAGAAKTWTARRRFRVRGVDRCWAVSGR